MHIYEITFSQCNLSSEQPQDEEFMLSFEEPLPEDFDEAVKEVNKQLDGIQWEYSGIVKIVKV